MVEVVVVLGVDVVVVGNTPGMSGLSSAATRASRRIRINEEKPT